MPSTNQPRKTLILTGMAANICVLFTADDAYMRGYELIVPRDCALAQAPIWLPRGRVAK